MKKKTANIVDETKSTLVLGATGVGKTTSYTNRFAKQSLQGNSKIGGIVFTHGAYVEEFSKLVQLNGRHGDAIHFFCRVKNDINEKRKYNFFNSFKSIPSEILSDYLVTSYEIASRSTGEASDKRENIINSLASTIDEMRVGGAMITLDTLKEAAQSEELTNWCAKLKDTLSKGEIGDLLFSENPNACVLEDLNNKKILLFGGMDFGFEVQKHLINGFLSLSFAYIFSETQLVKNETMYIIDDIHELKGIILSMKFNFNSNVKLLLIAQAVGLDFIKNRFFFDNIILYKGGFMNSEEFTSVQLSTKKQEVKKLAEEIQPFEAISIKGDNLYSKINMDPICCNTGDMPNWFSRNKNKMRKLLNI